MSDNTPTPDDIIEYFKLQQNYKSKLEFSILLKDMEIAELKARISDLESPVDFVEIDESTKALNERMMRAHNKLMRDRGLNR